MTPRRVVLVFSIGVVWLACTEKAAQKEPAHPAATPAADTLAYAGHAMLFDKNFKEIKPDAAWILAVQDAILSEITKDEAVRKLRDGDPDVQAAMKFLRSNELPEAEELSLNAAVNEKLLQSAGAEAQRQYRWRNDAIYSHYWNQRPDSVQMTLRPDILEILRRLGRSRAVLTTDYIHACREQDVPIPPNWAERGTPWVLHGTLTTNMLRPREYAAVWTYTDPALRGACVALPRGNGGRGSQAGIICQSATTGHACFWDNILRPTDPWTPEVFVGWRDQTLVIADLKDGSNLFSPCTGCHRGDNVFLIAPDDPAWGRVLRGPDPTGRFTTRVESSSDETDGVPRYIPLTTSPPRMGWENPFFPRECGGACHELPTGSFTFPMTMPPECARGGLEDCYRRSP